MKHVIAFVVLVLLCTTGAAAQIVSAASGNWGTGATWVGGVVPGATDNVVIANGHTVTVNGTFTVASLTVGQGVSGILTSDVVAARSLTVTGNVTVAAGGSFVPAQLSSIGSNTSGSTTLTVASTTGLVTGMLVGGTGIPLGTTITVVNATTLTLSLAATSTNTGVPFTFGYNHTLAIGGNLVNNGSFDMSLGNAAAVWNVTFTATANQTVGGSGATTRFSGVTLNKGAIGNKVICNINVSTANPNITFTNGTWEQTAGRLTATSGSMNIGSLTVTSCALNIIGSGSASIASNINVYGTLLVNTSDSVIVGLGTNKIDMTYVAGAVATYTAGTVMVYGKFASSALTATTINGANIVIDPKGFATAVPPGTDYAFRVTTGGGTNPLTFTSGTVTILNPNRTASSSPELAMSSSVAPNISGTARFVLGRGAATDTSAQGFRINLNSVGLLNNLTLNTGSVDTRLQTNLTVKGALTMTSGNLALGGFTLTVGSSASAPGSLVATAGNVTGLGTMKRWFGSGAITGTGGTYPVGVGPYSRSLAVGGTVSRGGTVSVAYYDSNTVSQPFSPSFTENSRVFVNRFNARWTVAVGDSFAGSGLTLGINGNGIRGITAVGDLNVSGATGPAPGTYVAPTGTTSAPVVNRAGLTEATLPSVYYVASTASSPLPVAEASDLPVEFALSQNYPNPFNPSTSFSYQIPAAGLVTVKVFDLLGHEVATLVNEVRQPGTYSATWNAAGFGSGVYFCRMQAGSFVGTRKLVLMK